MINICFIDIDGVLTNGIYQISDRGIVTKSFYTRDFYGIEQLLKKGIKVIIISQSHDRVIYEQVDRIANHSVFWQNAYRNDYSLQIITKVDNKKEEVKKLLKEFELSWENVAYIGDAENDIECMGIAEVTGCPSDAICEIIDDVNFISQCPGGKGAVYEFCMDIVNGIEGGL